MVIEIEASPDGVCLKADGVIYIFLLTLTGVDRCSFTPPKYGFTLNEVGQIEMETGE